MSRFCILRFFFLEIECQIFFSMICSIGNLLTLVFSICEMHSMASVPSTDATGVALVWSGWRAMVSDLWTVSQTGWGKEAEGLIKKDAPLKWEQRLEMALHAKADSKRKESESWKLITKVLEKSGAQNQTLVVMTLRRWRRGRKNTTSTNTLAANIPRSTTTINLALQVKMMRKVVLMRIRKDHYVERDHKDHSGKVLLSHCTCLLNCW